jgi:hypothetical protein
LIDVKWDMADGNFGLDRGLPDPCTLDRKKLIEDAQFRCRYRNPQSRLSEQISSRALPIFFLSSFGRVPIIAQNHELPVHRTQRA